MEETLRKYLYPIREIRTQPSREFYSPFYLSYFD
nr:MAG TPA: hypothetical protein [Caudoviricetes sp.]